MPDAAVVDDEEDVAEKGPGGPHASWATGGYGEGKGATVMSNPGSVVHQGSLTLLSLRPQY